MMMIRRSRILKAAKTEMEPVRTIVRSNTRRRIAESVMKAGRAHRRRTFGVPYTEEKYNINVPRKEFK